MVEGSSPAKNGDNNDQPTSPISAKFGREGKTSARASKRKEAF